MELRWFVHAPIPIEVIRWFTASRTCGFVEERLDLYQIDGRGEVGLKRRGGETLELKIMLSSGDGVVLGSGLAGPVEHWRKWNPADGHHEVEARPLECEWTEVHKVVTKRSFSTSGTGVVERMPGVDCHGSGCEVEVTSVVVGHFEAWSLAFAARGPTEGAPGEIRAVWEAITSGGPAPSALARPDVHCDGYPAWLSRIVAGSCAGIG